MTNLLRVRLLGATVAALSACVNLGPAKDTTRFFTLTAVADQAAPAATGPTLGVGTVALPDYLHGSHLVERLGPSEVRPRTTDYWAGSLAAQMREALAENLETVLGQAAVPRYPWPVAEAPIYRLDVEVARFDADTGGVAELAADWEIVTVADGKVVRQGTGRWPRAASGRGMDAVVAAMSGALADFAKAMAGERHLLP